VFYRNTHLLVLTIKLLYKFIIHHYHIKNGFWTEKNMGSEWTVMHLGAFLILFWVLKSNGVNLNRHQPGTPAPPMVFPISWCWPRVVCAVQPVGNRFRRRCSGHCTFVHHPQRKSIDPQLLEIRLWCLHSLCLRSLPY